MKNMEYNHLDPETWKLKCNSCDNFVKYEKLSGYHNAKSQNVRGRAICCPDCKTAKLKVSKNPDDWQIPCSTCDNPIRYDNLASFRVVYGGYLRGNKRECESCSSLTRKNVVRKDRIYSRDPKDWVVDCKCGSKIQYGSLKSYQSIMSKINKGETPVCSTCYRKTKNWKCDQPKLPKRTVRISVEKEIIRTQYRKFDNSQRRVLRREFNIDNLSCWYNLSNVERDECVKYLAINLDTLIQKYTDEISQVRKSRLQERLKNSNSTFPVKPFVNLNSIPYINDVLNTEYDTKFIHGVDDSGEYRIYDHLEKRLIFADAYCPKLNIWVEIDEKNKFLSGILKKEHINRHHRIKDILKCQIIRIRYSIQANKTVFEEYYNDVVEVGNLNEDYKKTLIKRIEYNGISQ